MNPRLTAALLSVFEPLARLLLTNGTDARTVIEILKLAFVRVAQADFGNGGKPASISAVSKLTKLTRREVKRILEQEVESVSRSEFSADDEATILAHWMAHEEYLDADGNPRVLDFGPGPGSFSSLVQDSLGEGSPLRYLSRLSQKQCVIVQPDERIALGRRDWLVDSDIARLIGDGIGTAAATISKNHGRSRGEGLCQRMAYSTRMDPAKVDVMRRIARERIESFIEEIDDYFIGLETDSPAPIFDKAGNELVRIGVSAYYFEIER